MTRVKIVDFVRPLHPALRVGWTHQFSFSRGAAAAIVVYDITSYDSFNRAKQWVKELQQRGDTNVVIALAGNKLDLVDKRQVDTAVCDFHTGFCMDCDLAPGEKRLLDFGGLSLSRRPKHMLKTTGSFTWKPAQRPTTT